MTDEQQPPTPDPLPGANLRKLREEAGFSLQQVGDRTLIPLNRLEALEQDRYEAVGSSAHVAGYARAYARAIGAPPDAIVAAFEAALVQQRQRELSLELVRVGGPTDLSDNHRKLWLASAATAVIMGVLLALLLLYRLGGTEVDESARGRTVAPPAAPVVSPTPQERSQLTQRPSLPAERDATQESIPEARPLGLGTSELRLERLPETTSRSPESALPEDPSPLPTPVPQRTPIEARGGQLLEMSFIGECWVEVHDANGDRVVARLAQSGDNLRFLGDAPFDVLLGDARSASLSLNGEPVNISPRPGRNTLRLQVGP